MCVTVSLFLYTAYWVSHRAIKVVYDHEDGMTQSAHDITAVKRLIVEKFKVRHHQHLMLLHLKPEVNPHSK